MPGVSTGELITRWTVRAAMALYAVSLALQLAPGRSGRRLLAARILWTAGCALFLAHVAAAFQFYHGWSHAAAVRDTARQTKAMFGVDWGGGVWFNYVFAVLWMVDVAWWWIAGAGRYFARPRLVTVGIRTFMLFIGFNATVVFAVGWTRWIGAVACAGLLIIVLGGGWRRRGFIGG